MAIERFKNQDPIPVYRRVCDPGIKFPDGLTCRELDRTELRPLLPTDGMRRLWLLEEWALANNRDLRTTFEIVPVVPSKETLEVVASFLDEK